MLLLFVIWEVQERAPVSQGSETEPSSIPPAEPAFFAGRFNTCRQIQGSELRFPASLNTLKIQPQ